MEVLNYVLVVVEKGNLKVFLSTIYIEGLRCLVS